MKQTVELIKNADGTWEMTLPEPAATANLEKSMSAYMDTEIMGVPVVSGVVGGAVAELAVP